MSGLALASCAVKLPYATGTENRSEKGIALFGYADIKSKLSTLRVLNWNDLSYIDYALPFYKNPHFVKKNIKQGRTR